MSPVPADDPALALAIDFLNTYDNLETPPDQLSLDLVRRLATRHSFGSLPLAGLESLRALRERLRPVFAAPELADKVAALNHVLQAAAASASVRLVDDRAALYATGGRGESGEFAVLIADALTRALAAGGPARFGTCAADPCRCVYVDRTRSGRQRYCCELCNDRVAAAAYRRRKSPSSGA